MLTYNINMDKYVINCVMCVHDNLYVDMIVSNVYK